MLPYGHGCFTVCERERSSSDQALQCPAEGHILTPAGQELGGRSHEQFSVPVPGAEFMALARPGEKDEEQYLHQLFLIKRSISCSEASIFKNNNV